MIAAALRRFIALPLVLGVTPFSQAADRELLLGAVHKDTVFAVPGIEVKRLTTDPPATLLQGPLHAEPDKQYKPCRYEFKPGVLCNQPYRWRIVHDMFWGSGSTGARRFS